MNVVEDKSSLIVTELENEDSLASSPVVAAPSLSSRLNLRGAPKSTGHHVFNEDKMLPVIREIDSRSCLLTTKNSLKVIHGSYKEVINELNKNETIKNAFGLENSDGIKFRLKDVDKGTEEILFRLNNIAVKLISPKKTELNSKKDHEPFIPITILYDGTYVIGPVLDDESKVCIDCLTSRLKMNAGVPATSNSNKIIPLLYPQPEDIF